MQNILGKSDSKIQEYEFIQIHKGSREEWRKVTGHFPVEIEIWIRIEKRMNWINDWYWMT